MLLEVRDLRTHIRTRRLTIEAVDGVSLSIGAGETVGLVGESGSGKSMTAMSVMRLLPPGGQVVGGSVRLGSKELMTMSDREMREIRGNEVAVVFQDPMSSLNPTMTIGDQVAEPLAIHRDMSKQARRDRALELLTVVGMPKPRERLTAYPHHLSGGLRQRAGIAMALACEPSLLIADEPTTALDVTTQAQILALLDDLKARMGMGMLLITHDMGVIATRTDRVLVMYAGRIVEAADTAELFRAPRHPYTQALLEARPDLGTRKGGALYSIPGFPPDLTRPPVGSCRFAPRCRYADAQCVQADPSLDSGEAAHPVACFHPLVSPNASSAGRGGASTLEKPEEREGPGESPTSEQEDDRHTSNASTGTRQAGPLLVVEHVVKEFLTLKGGLQRKLGSVKAVSDVSFEVDRGETFGLVGESGCGKSTLGRLIAALEKPDGGSVRFDGEDLGKARPAELRRRRREFQLMFQDPYSSLDPRMRVGAILREPLASQQIGSRKTRGRLIEDVLAEVGLSHGAAGLYPHEFSGGQRQRIGLARAIILEPSLVVADEPVSALDVSVQAQVLNLMKRLQADRGLTYVVISHDLAVVRYLADRIGVMYLGKLVEVGPADEIYERPAHPYTGALLDAVPEPNPSGRAPAVLQGELPSALDPPSGCRFRTRCPHAQSICAETEPQLRPFDVLTHEAACHFPLRAPLGDVDPTFAQR